MRRGIPYLALSEGLDTHKTVAVATGGCSAVFGLGLFLFLRLTGNVEDVLSSLKAPAFQCGLDFDERLVDDIALVQEVNADLLGALHAHTRLDGDARAEGLHVAAVSALTVLQEVDEHLG